MSAGTPQPNQFALLGQRRFAPFFWTQFLGAANDNADLSRVNLFTNSGRARARPPLWITSSPSVPGPFARGAL